MINIPEIPLQNILLAVLAALVIIAGVVLYVRRHRSMPARIARALDSISHDQLQDFFLPDGMGGHIHFDVLLLTNRGFVVLDIKDVPGTLFGSEKMEEWVVMSGRRRHTFRNPLAGLHDRLAVVRSLMRDIHSEAWLVFTDRGRFTKGVPRETIMLDELVEKIGPAGAEYPQAFDAAWKEIQRLAEKAQEETQRPE
jgi:hypothetical protein